MDGYQVIVVGGGPSGSSCSIFLGKKGVRTLLVDKASFPRDKTCGDGITGKSSGILRELGIEHRITEGPHEKINGLITSSPSGVTIDFNPSDEIPTDPLYVCKRLVFDNMLFKEAKNTADVIENFTVTDVLMENGKVAGIRGLDKNGAEKEFRANVVVGADGANSAVARKLGLNNFETDKSLVSVRAYYKNVSGTKDRIEFHFLEELLPGYFWIFPAGDDISNVGLAVIAGDVPKKRLNLKTMLEDVVKKSRFAERFKNATQVSDIRGWNLPTGAQNRKRAGNGFVLVGDAASLIDPFTGEGIGNALLSGKLAAETISNAIDKNDFSYTALKEYEDEIQHHMGKEFEANYKFQKFGRNPLMFNALVEELSTDAKYMKMATSAFYDTTNMAVNFRIPLSLYLRVFVRYLKSYMKMKFGRKQ